MNPRETIFNCVRNSLARGAKLATETWGVRHNGFEWRPDPSGEVCALGCVLLELQPEGADQEQSAAEALGVGSNWIEEFTHAYDNPCALEGRLSEAEEIALDLRAEFHPTPAVFA